MAAVPPATSLSVHRHRRSWSEPRMMSQPSGPAARRSPSWFTFSISHVGSASAQRPQRGEGQSLSAAVNDDDDEDDDTIFALMLDDGLLERAAEELERAPRASASGAARSRAGGRWAWKRRCSRRRRRRRCGVTPKAKGDREERRLVTTSRRRGRRRRGPHLEGRGAAALLDERYYPRRRHRIGDDDAGAARSSASCQTRSRAIILRLTAHRERKEHIASSGRIGVDTTPVAAAASPTASIVAATARPCSLLVGQVRRCKLPSGARLIEGIFVGADFNSIFRLVKSRRRHGSGCPDLHPREPLRRVVAAGGGAESLQLLNVRHHRPVAPPTALGSSGGRRAPVLHSCEAPSPPSPPSC